MVTVEVVRRVQILKMLKIELARVMGALDVSFERKGEFRDDSRILT